MSLDDNKTPAGSDKSLGFASASCTVSNDRAAAFSSVSGGRVACDEVADEVLGS